MHDHHHHCLHFTLGYCAICDVTYCRNCGREWGVRQYTSVGTYMPYAPYYGTGIHQWSTSGTLGGSTISTSSGEGAAGHSHS
jgi:hypothetical protein